MTLVRRLLLSPLICTLFSCAIPPRPMSVPSIQPTAEWQIVERCGYEGCYPLVDYLIGKGIQVRVKAENDLHDKRIFAIVVDYSLPEKSCYQYRKSLSILSLSDRRSLLSKDSFCNGIMAESYANSTQPFQLHGPVHKGERSDCFRLHFDVPAPSTEDTFTLKLRGLETCDGTPVEFPELHFSRGMR
jgi:hypothetical protein